MPYISQPYRRILYVHSGQTTRQQPANLLAIPHLDIPPFLRIIQVNRRAYKGNDRGKYVGRCRQRGAGNAETRARPKPTEVPSRAVQVKLQ